MKKTTRLPMFFFVLAVFLSAVSFSFSVTFTKDSNFIYVDGEKTIIKGITYSPFYPGETHSDVPKKADIGKDMKLIKELGANTILLYWLRDERIYKEAKKQGLYIIQGVTVENNPRDFQDENFKKQIKKRIRYLTDTIHNYNGSDYSDIILAYWVGGEFDEGAVNTTNRIHADSMPYKGTYVSAPDDANATESFLAETADYLKSHVRENYNRDAMVSHINWPVTDNLIETPFLDIALFDVYSYWPEKVYSHPKGKTTRTAYQGYIEGLKKNYGKMPLIISEFGYATAPENPTESGNSESMQAVYLLNRWTDIITAEPPLAGGLVFEWSDEWYKQSKAAKPVPAAKDKLYHEKDDYEEWFGIISIDGNSFKDYDVRPKPAYYSVKWMYSDDFDPVQYMFKSRIRKDTFDNRQSDLGIFISDSEYLFKNPKAVEEFFSFIENEKTKENKFTNIFINLDEWGRILKKEDTKLKEFIEQCHKKGCKVHYFDSGEHTRLNSEFAKRLLGRLSSYNSDVGAKERFDGVIIDYYNKAQAQSGKNDFLEGLNRDFIDITREISNDIYEKKTPISFGAMIPPDITEDFAEELGKNCDYLLVKYTGSEKDIFTRLERISDIVCRYNNRIMLSIDADRCEDILDKIPEDIYRNYVFSGIAIDDYVTLASPKYINTTFGRRKYSPGRTRR
ncbi:hypothetical protein M0R36_06085 [bacterium]|nr:hypothetical protein [bacterium]